MFPCPSYQISDHASTVCLELSTVTFRLSAPISPLECAVTKTRVRKSFRMRSYEKRWGEGAQGKALPYFPFSLFHFQTVGGGAIFQFRFFELPMRAVAY